MDHGFNYLWVYVSVPLITFTLMWFIEKIKQKGTETQDESEIVRKNILTRRTIGPENCLEDAVVPKDDILKILEAAHWAPTHKNTEPWYYVVHQGPEEISSYLDFLEDFYDGIKETLPENESNQFNLKMSNARNNWTRKTKYLIVIGMRRQQPDADGGRLPEWEEICAVAMSVENMHLMASSLNLGGFWSSHTWCKRARDHEDYRKFVGLSGPEDRCFGAFLVGKVDDRIKSKAKSNRTNINTRVKWISN